MSEFPLEYTKKRRYHVQCKILGIVGEQTIGVIKNGFEETWPELDRAFRKRQKSI